MKNIVMLAAAKPDRLAIRDIQSSDGSRFSTHIYSKGDGGDGETIVADRTGQLFITPGVRSDAYLNCVHNIYSVYEIRMAPEGLAVIHYPSTERGFNPITVVAEHLKDNKDWLPIATFERAEKTYWETTTIKRWFRCDKFARKVLPEFQRPPEEVYNVVDDE